MSDSIDISNELAMRLSQSLGASPGFWLNRSTQYKQDLERVEADQWARRAPNELFTSLGWVRSGSDWRERIANLLEFFELPDFTTWKNEYDSVIAQAQYRRHSAGDTNDVAVAAWLRRAKLVASRISVASFDVRVLESSVNDIRRLTRIKDPAEFIPRLEAILARAGVALVVIRPPKGCPISGARSVTLGGAPMIVLSGRYLVDDHLWFTLFHEIAHVIMHSVDTFIDRLDEGGSDESESIFEREADEWAGATIVLESILSQADGKRVTRRLVAKLAALAGVPSGLIVGQLQHRGCVEFGQLNWLKRRYSWNGGSLELNR